MKKTNCIYLIFVGCSLLIMYACTPKSPIQYSSPILPSTTYDYLFADEFKNNTGQNFDNLLDETKPYYTNEIVTLGRVLFYDKQLSANGSTSCGTCHQQKFAFAENKKASNGFTNIVGKRNAPSLINARFNWSFFWDARGRRLEEIMLLPVANHIEMGFENIASLPARLRQINYYPALFKNAFGTENITTENMSIAMAHFLRSLISNETRIDQSGIFSNSFNPNNNMLSASEIRGANIFRSSKAKCASCHLQNQFGKGQMENIGLDIVSEDIGFGIEGEGEVGKFTTPSIRNLPLTAPYMHDGRFATLSEVLDHYSDNIKNHAHLSNQLMNANATPIHFKFTTADKQDLINFFNAFTDFNIIANSKFSNPFPNP